MALPKKKTDVSSSLGVNLQSKRVVILVTTLLVPILQAALVHAASPSDDFEEGVRLDLEGKASLAFSSYLRAANAGLSQAQFDVAVMLDSGRGTVQNMPQAAFWYAHAAAHGNQRAAYNMGQLYQSGEGVPQNLQMARAWFAASGLPASSAHLRDPVNNGTGDTITLSAPELIAPAAGSSIAPERGGVVLLWTIGPQPVAVSFYVELRKIEPSGSHEIFSTSSNISSIYEVISDFRSKLCLEGYHIFNSEKRVLSQWMVPLQHYFERKKWIRRYSCFAEPISTI